MNHNHPQQNSGRTRFWGTRYSTGLIVLGAVAVYFLTTEHRAHALSALPVILLLVCPLMHVFMHGGHGHHDNGQNHSGHLGRDASTKPQPPETGKQP